MRRLVRGGTLVTAAGERTADVLIDGETIERVGPNLSRESADADIDATGLHVFPGFIDPHVHARDPGLTQKEDFAHLTRAAAAGGITTVLVMPNAVPAVTDVVTFDRQATQHEATAHIDFGLWALALGNETSTDLARLAEAGAVATKLFWGYAFDRRTGTLRYDAVDAMDPDVIPPAGNGDVWRLLRAAGESGIVVGVHCEDHSVTTVAAAAGAPARSPTELMVSRPAEAEAVAVASLIELARASGARIHVLHTSTARSVELIRRARADGIAVTAETCPHYLTLDPHDLTGPAARTKVYPPLRGGAEAEALWEGLSDGTIESVSSDHAPHGPTDRSGPYEDQPAGIAGTQSMVPVVIDAARRRGVPLGVLAERLSEGAARLYGLYPRKGSLDAGADADLTMVDLESPWRIDAADMYSKDRQSPWQGMEGRGRPVVAMVRGRIVMRDGRPVGEPAGHIVKPGAR